MGKEELFRGFETHASIGPKPTRVTVRKQQCIKVNVQLTDRHSNDPPDAPQHHRQEGSLEINSRDVKIIVVLEFAPHAQAGLPILRIGRGGINTHGNVQLSHNGSHLFFKIGQAF